VSLWGKDGRNSGIDPGEYLITTRLSIFGSQRGGTGKRETSHTMNNQDTKKSETNLESRIRERAATKKRSGKVQTAGEPKEDDLAAPGCWVEQNEKSWGKKRRVLSKGRKAKA